MSPTSYQTAPPRDNWKDDARRLDGSGLGEGRDYRGAPLVPSRAFVTFASPSPFPGRGWHGYRSSPGRNDTDLPDSDPGGGGERTDAAGFSRIAAARRFAV